ncbi:hypothetical protein Tco_1229104 [Tanacetum coccineum]
MDPKSLYKVYQMIDPVNVLPVNLMTVHDLLELPLNILLILNLRFQEYLKKCMTNINSVRPNINTGRVNVNFVRPNVNTGRVNVNSVRPNVNTGRVNVNSVKSNVNTDLDSQYLPRPQTALVLKDLRIGVLSEKLISLFGGQHCLGDDASKQGRIDIGDINTDAEITLIDETQGRINDIIADEDITLIPKLIIKLLKM